MKKIIGLISIIAVIFIFGAYRASYGIDEHIKIADYVEDIQYFHELFRKVSFDNEAQNKTL